MWLILVALGGCRSPAVSAFLADRAAAICDRHATCDTLSDAGYASEADCLDAVDASTGVLADEGALACDVFDAAAAEACLAVYAETACGEVLDVSGCDAVCAET